MQILSGSINLNLIDKTKIKKVQLKDGTTASFIDVSVIVNDEQDKFGNIAGITAGQTKEERDAKAKKTYLGNLKRVWASEGTATAKASAPSNTSPFEDDSSLPF